MAKDDRASETPEQARQRAIAGVKGVFERCSRCRRRLNISRPACWLGPTPPPRTRSRPPAGAAGRPPPAQHHIIVSLLSTWCDGSTDAPQKNHRWTRMADHIGYDGFDNKVFREVVVVDAAAGAALEQQRQSPDTAFPPPPSAVASSVTSLYIDPCYRNLNNVVHGGAFSLIFDLLTTIALGAVEEPDHWAIFGGVSRTLNVSYLKALPLGVTVHVHAHVYGIGKTMAFIQGWMTSEDGKTVYATCEHHKAFVPSMKQRIKYDLPAEFRNKDGLDKKREAKL
ncbi:uncharacterized protein E0L32_007650 [Thyridium curvatum]|uniref:Thioesterase domain-containing protein n=1 Tax=Thyridium curvatum TaxID=1093900 RepID=A0A507B3P7_9PEZI|nr:uncharacterized protein E0L32_007650 [Thyridium curvatum]TPX11671.1 hypothetical protein E0L32_007650 [Thyridium curvatum]